MNELIATAPYKRILCLDFETVWDRKTGYSLSVMTNEQYVRDKRFHAWGMSYLWLDDLGRAPQWLEFHDLPAFFKTVDWSTTAVLAQNAQFDVSILSWIYNVKPCFIFDTLSMARALFGIEVGNSLKKLAERFELPPKGNAINSTEGLFYDVNFPARRRLQPYVEEELAEYCNHDVSLCLAVFDHLARGYPTKELRLIDMTIKMYVNPVLELDQNMLIEAIADEKEKREGLLERLGIVETDLASNDKFATVLESMGVEPPKKISKTTQKEAFAFAKNDAMFQALVNHEREDISLLCETRLAVKSTLERTRAQRFLDVARRGKLPVPLSYYGAHTGRWAASKGSGLNMQNLKRGSFLRRAIHAPDGYVLGVCDLSQIEVRVLAWLADHRQLLQTLTKLDPYAEFGASMFGIPGLTKETHPDLRQSAKSALLGCGYGLGWASFSSQLLTGFLGAAPVLYGISFAKQLGLTAADVMAFCEDPEHNEKMALIPRTCSNDELAVHCTVTKTLVDRYRKTSQPVVKLWKLADDMISRCLVSDSSVSRFGGGKTIKHKCLTFTQGQILLPNGMPLRYPDLQGSPNEKGWVQWVYGEHCKKLYGGKLVENFTQAVARIVMTDGMLRIQKRYPCVLTVHDEVVALLPEDDADAGIDYMKECMLKEPKYLPGIPLGVTTGVAKRYGDAKD